jgi:hypothetical protein
VGLKRFRVVNSSRGVFWIDDTKGDKRWPDGMGITVTMSENEVSAKSCAERMAEVLNELAQDAEKAKAEGKASASKRKAK